MESALRPRDIQARIRAGESVEDVARAAGVPVERIDAFAAPVIAEREHVAGLAQANPVRRRGESSSNRALRTATTEHLMSHGIDPDRVSWDAYLLGARRWRVRATFEHNGRTHEGAFVYDVNGRFSVADNDDARWMIGETGADERQAPTPAEDDELALVRAVADAAGPPDDSDELNDAYTEAALAEIDGVYDLVTGDDPHLDALYDMLASFDEDSVKIYSGLIRPEANGPVVADAVGAPSADTPDLPEGARVEPLYVPEDVLAVRPDAAPAPSTDAAGAEPTVPVPMLDEPPTADTESTDATEAEAPTDDASPTPQRRRTTPREPEQPSLVEGEPPAARRKPRNKRASVPSWDEIMFGSPRQGPQKP
nr:DUF3071 domain-containing protein [Propionibacterium sp.]